MWQSKAMRGTQAGALLLNLGTGAPQGWYLRLTECKSMCHTQIQFTLIVGYLLTHLKHLEVFGKGGRSKTDEPAEIPPRSGSTSL